MKPVVVFSLPYATWDVQVFRGGSGQAMSPFRAIPGIFPEFRSALKADGHYPHSIVYFFDRSTSCRNASAGRIISSGSFRMNRWSRSIRSSREPRIPSASSRANFMGTYWSCAMLIMRVGACILLWYGLPSKVTPATRWFRYVVSVGG